MALFNVFAADLPGTAGRWHFLGREAGDPVDTGGHYPYPPEVEEASVLGTCQVQLASLFPSASSPPLGKAPEFHS